LVAAVVSIHSALHFVEGFSVKEQSLTHLFADLSTPLIADAALRLHIPLRIARPGIAPVLAGQRLAGSALPATHFGSVDVFLEAIRRGKPGDVLVIDNGGRPDEGCIGDLTALEARACALLASSYGVRIVIRSSCARLGSPSSVTARGPLVRNASTRAMNQPYG
jgi:hypothetical protein